jgi:hypothetical protein
MLLSTNSEGNKAWRLAAGESEPEKLHKMWEWAIDILTIDEVKNKLLLSKDNYGYTAWHWAVVKNVLNPLQEISDLAPNILTTEEIENNLLLFTNINGK